MKVKEIIEKLKACDQEAECVVHASEFSDFDLKELVAVMEKSNVYLTDDGTGKYAEGKSYRRYANKTGKKRIRVVILC